MLAGKKILIGITGSIAAYKTILLVRLLVKAGAEVKIILTPAAKDFVSSIVLSTLSKNKVFVDFIQEESWSNHVMLGRWADVFLIAPLSCNTLSKMANGECDNLLLAVYLSSVCPVVVAPAMDEEMWHHPSIKRNIELIKKDGIQVLDVRSGELASGIIGEGRMLEPESIFQYLIETFFRKNNFKNKKVLITAGPTYEKIDPVRYIGNHSSGKMGFALAEEFYLQGADVILITGPTGEQISYKGISVVNVADSDEMFKACIDYFSDCIITVMSAAVADYKPVEFSAKKIKKNDDQWQLQLTKTKDILKQLGILKREGQYIAGFALETDNEKENAIAKLKSKNADCIILNSLSDSKAGFGYDTNKITIMDQSGKEQVYDLKTKKEVAKDIISYIIARINV